MATMDGAFPYNITYRCLHFVLIAALCHILRTISQLLYSSVCKALHWNSRYELYRLVAKDKVGCSALEPRHALVRAWRFTVQSDQSNTLSKSPTPSSYTVHTLGFLPLSTASQGVWLSHK